MEAACSRTLWKGKGKDTGLNIFRIYCRIYLLTRYDIGYKQPSRDTRVPAIRVGIIPTNFREYSQIKCSENVLKI